MSSHARGARVAAAAVLMLVASACGKSALRTANASLQTSFQATTAAKASFLDWSRQHEHELVMASTTHEEGRAALDRYRAKSQIVVEAFALAYASIAAGAAALPLLEAGKLSEAEATQLVADALHAALAVKSALEALKGAP